MSKTVLFSPVGGTDPIAEVNMRDGSLLHICRVYKPDKVILYMSKEILDKQNKDDRYRRALRMLATAQGRDMEIVCIERPELDRVQEFDYFYHDFDNLLRKISDELDEHDDLLLNISSGTPAMKSGLLVLRTLGEIRARTIQVKTPERKMNVHEHSENYDLDSLWELDEDNAYSFENRCEEVFCPTLSDLIKKEIIKKHITIYDYKAALDVAQTITHLDPYVQSLLEMALERSLLNIDYCLKKERPFRLPIRQERYRDCFEYALNVYVKLKRKEYGDFVRAISPLIMDLFELVLEFQCHISIDDYTRISAKGVRIWDGRKLANTELEAILTDYYQQSGYGFNYSSFVKSEDIKAILHAKTDQQKILKIVDALKKVESGDTKSSGIRNLAAHEIISVTDEKIKARTGLSGDQIMSLIKQLFKYTGIKIQEEDWDSYEWMNQLIIDALFSE